MTVRTLRYYDRIGLLTPADRSDAGYRRYSHQDLSDLGQILALKYLGFSLEEAYSDEAKAELASRGPWTEPDQKRVDAQYAELAAELERLVADGADPGSDAAQAAAKRQIDLLDVFTQGDPELEKGLQAWWSEFAEHPSDQKPPALPWGEQEARLLGEAMEIYRKRNA